MPEDRARKNRGLIAGAVLGAVTAGVALAVGEAVSIFTGPATAPVDAVGSAAVNLTPARLKDYAVAHFGEHDKQYLVSGIVAVLAVIALAAGVLALRKFWIGAVLVLLFGTVGVIAAASLANSAWDSWLPSAIGAIVAVGVLWWLVRLYQRSSASSGADGRTVNGNENSGGLADELSDISAVPPEEVPAPIEPVATARTQRAATPNPQPSDQQSQTESSASPDDVSDRSSFVKPNRRGFVLGVTGVAVVSAAGGFGANLISGGKFSVTGARAAVKIPRPAFPAPPVPAGVHPNVAGLSSFFTDNDAFYRVDTALVLPQVRPEAWTLRIHGLVDHPVEFSFDDLLKQPLYEHDLTVSCVSDPVGGPYVGNARWIGADLPALLRSTGIQKGADQLLSRSVDGMTIGTPLASILDGRRALLAVAMNGEPLPVAHGFPARTLVPGFYGYASAAKWVTDLEVTTFAAQKAYWVQRGYAQIGTMKTQSRIDVPKPFARVSAGQVTVAGIAWATDRGISAVQVQVDGGSWEQATLAAQDSPDTWRQWTYDWKATSGLHTLGVRAADDSGQYQTGVRAEPLPNGASGWENLVVTVV